MAKSLLTSWVILFLFCVLIVGQLQGDGTIEAKYPPRVLGTVPPVVDSEEQLEKMVNRLVTIKGKLSSGKIPRILGVEVGVGEYRRTDEHYAVGILCKFVSKEGRDRSSKASDEQSVKFILYSDLQGKLAVAKPMN